MYKKSLITITASSILMLSACSGGIENDLKTALNTNKEKLQICGSYRPSTRTITINGGGFKNIRIKAYPAKGEAPKVETKRGGSASLCFGGRSVNDIIEFTKPSDFGGMKMTEVTFSYKIDFNDIASKLRIEESLQKAYSDPLQGKAVLVETNKGWRVEKISWPKNQSLDQVIISEKYAREEYSTCAVCQDVLRDGAKMPVDVLDPKDGISPELFCNGIKSVCTKNGIRW